MVNKDADKPLLKHQILNSLRLFNEKYRDEYGQMVICCDSHSWRKDYFEYYKASRKTGREKDEETKQHWDTIYSVIAEMIDDLKENFPYKVIKVHGAEADDVIGTLAYHTQEFGNDEKVMIVSSDKDFAQLLKFKNVKQFSPMKAKLVEEKNPEQFLVEHILKGDSSDGIPNVRSPDNIFTVEGRQTPVSKKFIQSVLDADWREDSTVWNDEIARNYDRNKMLIDLSCTPNDIKQEIINIYNTDDVAPKSKVLPYLISNRMNMLIESVSDFL